MRDGLGHYAGHMIRRTRRGSPSAAQDTSLSAVALASLGSTLSWSAGLAGIGAVARGLERVNYRGRTVSLRGGVGVAVGAVVAGSAAGWALSEPAAGPLPVPVAAVVAASAGGAAGLVDDLDAGAHDGQDPAKGLSGHLGALARGQVTTGVLKIAVIGTGALISGTLLALHRPVGSRRPAAVVADAATSAVVIASWANVLNLLDLRPGRSLKAAGLLAAPLLADPRPQSRPARALAAGALGTVVAALPEDLLEDTMLGDTGANAVGALVGTALAAHPSRVLRGMAALGGVGLVLASEKVSFSRVITRTPVLAALDAMGRRP